MEKVIKKGGIGDIKIMQCDEAPQTTYNERSVPV